MSNKNLLHRNKKNIKINSTFVKTDKLNSTSVQTDKFDGIDGIFWINLDRAIDRKNIFNEQINSYNCDIPVIRISGYDNSLVNISDLIINLDSLNTKNMKNNEVCCLLSHIYAIYTASLYEGNYFLILEDDVSMNNLKYINTLKNVILDCPSFDILMLAKTCCDKKKLLTNELYTLRTDDSVCGTPAYVISKTGIEKIKKLFIYENNKFFVNTNYISPADFYIYENCITYLYKYNLFFDNSKTSLLEHDLKHIRNSNMINNSIIYKNLNQNGYLC